MLIVEDRYVPVANAATLVEAIPDARLRVLNNAGHLVFIERCAEANREVDTFLKRRKQRKRGPKRMPPEKLVERVEVASRRIVFCLEPRKIGKLCEREQTSGGGRQGPRRKTL